MRFISLFAGIGGFDVALTRAGMSCVAQVEIDRDARRILERHFPEALRFTDIRKVHGAAFCRDGGCEWCLPACDVLCGGWPCQDLSVAGLRAGLAGDRSGLWVEFRRLIAELAPRWVFAENVPGLLSSWSPAEPAPECVDGGRWEVEEASDLGSVLADLGELGYWWAYRILDAQYFGLAQRRERVLIVGRAGNVAAAGSGGVDMGSLAGLPARVLFDPEGLPGNPSPREQARARTAASAGAGAASGGVGGGVTEVAYTIPSVRRGVGNGHNTTYVSDVISTLQGGGRRGHRVDAESAGGAIDPVSALTSSHGGADDTDAQAGHLIVAQTDRPTDRPTEEVSNAIRSGQGSASRGGHVLDAAVRRLTPREAERLQGFDDDWTLLDAAGKALADSPRYRLIGNAVAIPVIEWIARRIAAVDAGLPLPGAGSREPGASLR